MKTYARMDGNTVSNVEVADDAWVASQPDPSIFIEYTEANPACVGGDYVDGFFYVPQPFPSWGRDGNGNWASPVPYPDDGGWYTWDEATTSWVTV